MAHPAIEQLKELGKQVEDLRAQMKEAAQVALKDGTKAIFEEYGDVLYQFGWTQYAPSFNDGEPCEFSMHDLILISQKDVDTAKAEDPDYYEDVVNDWWSDSGSDSFGGWRGKAVDQRHQEAREAAEVIYSVIDEDISRSLFGDSVKIIFSAEGVDVEEYDCGY